MRKYGMSVVSSELNSAKQTPANTASTLMLQTILTAATAESNSPRVLMLKCIMNKFQV